jgi:hypothetical protein
MMLNNTVYLKGMLYLKNADHLTRLSGRPFIDCKITTGAGSVVLFEQHDVLLLGYQAVRALAYIRANNDYPVKVQFEGKLLSRRGVMICQAVEVEYFVSEAIDTNAKEIIKKLKRGDSFLKAGFQKTAMSHIQLMQASMKLGVPVEG